MLAYTDAGCAHVRAVLRFPDWVTMVETRIKPYLEQQAEEARREEQRRQFRRNQVFGLVLLAAIIGAWWLFHTNPKWIFPPGWWRW
jgi:hypothetical protein